MTQQAGSGKHLDRASNLKKKRKRIKRNEDNLRDTWDNIKQGNINTRVVPEGEEN